MKTQIIPGNEYSVEEFASTLRKAKIAKDKFLKLNPNGYYSYDTRKNIPKEDVDKLLAIVGDEQNIYNYFNTKNRAYDIELVETGRDREKVESANIYDKMAARSTTHYKGSFKITLQNGQPPITVSRTFSKDTTLSMRDIVNFM